MTFPGLYLLVFFIEFVLETGAVITGAITTELSMRNLLIYGGLLIAIFQIITGKKISMQKQLRTALFIFLAVVFYALITMTFPEILDLKGYSFTIAFAAIKNDIFDGLVVVFLSNFFLRKEAHILWLINAMLLVVGVGSALTFLDATLFHGLCFGLMKETLRARGVFGEPNQTAAALALFFPVVLSFIASDQKRLVNLAIVTALLLGLLATGSRGGMVGYLVGAMSLLYTMRKTISIQKRILIILLMVLGICLAWAILPDLYRDQIMSRLGILVSDKATARDMSAGRTMLWEDVLKVWSINPIFGIGWHGFQDMYHVATHNLYLEYLVGIGMVGLSLILFGWYKLLRYLVVMSKFGDKKQRASIQGIVAGCLGLLAALMFVNLYKPWLIVWAFLGPMTALCNLRFNQQVKALKMRSITPAVQS